MRASATVGVLLSILLAAACESERCIPTYPQPTELSLLWRTPTSWSWLGTPAVVDTLFYLEHDYQTISEATITDGRVTNVTHLDQSPFWDRPVTSGSTLFLSCGNSNVCAFDLRSNLSLLWSTYVFPPDSLDCCGGHIEWLLSPVVVDSSRLYFASQDGSAYCLDRSSGALLWKCRLPGSSVAAPALVGGVLYVADSDSSFLSAIDARSGTPLWRVSLGQRTEFCVLKSLGPLIYGEGIAGVVYCIDSESHRLKWQRKVGTGLRCVISVTENLICAADKSGICGLDPQTGCCRWRRNDIGGEGPTEVNGRIYCFSTDGGLFVLDARTGATLATATCGTAGFFNEPVVVSERVLAATYGEIYCFLDLTD
jgi:outer membrane protein assembly factor BamB